MFVELFEMRSAYTAYYNGLPSQVAHVLRLNGIHSEQPDGELLANIRNEEPLIWQDIVQSIGELYPQPLIVAQRDNIEKYLEY